MNKLISDWATINGVSFVSRSYGQYTTHPVSLDSLNDLMEAVQSAEKLKWSAALRCNGTCPPCRDSKNCKREAVGLPRFCAGG